MENLEQAFKQQQQALLQRIESIKSDFQQARSKDFSEQTTENENNEVLLQLKSEAEKGNIKKISIEDFMMNLVSMCIFPIVARPIFGNVLQLNKDEYDALLEKRKIEIPKFVMGALTH